MRALVKVSALIARAVDAGASTEEQRTSAWIACRIIKENDLHVSERELARPSPAASSYYSPPPPVDSRRVISSQYDGRCRECDQPYEAGDRVAWARGEGAVHVTCWRRAS